MSRAHQAEHAAEREEEAATQDFADGLITRDEYNRRIREIQNDVEAAYESDREDALRDVDAEWGRW